ncbi:hypothetical protein N7527_002454 [Penicillium freii]|nr:hypothetical protein N7527_002454 [Penicillium freii]
MDQDTCFKKLRKTFDQRDQEVENLEQEVEKQQKQVQELQSKLLLQEDRHQEELSRRRILDCKICYEQPDCWHNLLCGHMIYRVGTVPVVDAQAIFSFIFDINAV